MKKMSLNKKVWILTFLAWIVNTKLFLILSNWEQTWQIWKYSKSVWNFYTNIFKYYTEFIFTIPTITLILTIIFSVTLFIFWYSYFKVYFYKLPQIVTKQSGFFGFFATIFTFLGFGCVACGQTLLTSLIFLFFSSGSLFLVEVLGNIVMVIGIILLLFGVKRNFKLLNDTNICKI